MLLCSRKRLKILDVNCLPLSCKIFLGFPLTIIHSSGTSRTSILLFLSEYLLVTRFEQSSIQLMDSFSQWIGVYRMVQVYPFVPCHLDASLQIACTFCS